MRIALAPLVIAIGATVACNAIVGYDDLEKAPAGKSKSSSSSGEDGDDDITSSSSSSGKVGSSSGTSSGSNGGDAGSGAAACDLTKDFGAPVTLTGPINDNAGAFTGNATLTTDELTIVLQKSTDPSNGKVMRATRTSVTQDFGAPAEMKDLVQVNKDYGPGLRADGLFIFWSEDVEGGRQQIMLATRASATVDFEDPKPFEFTSSQKFDTQPFPSADGTELYFSSDRATTNQTLRLHRVTTTATGWTAPAELTELKSNGSELRATLSYDGLTLYFGSDRTPSKGDADIYVAKRPNKASPFADIKALDALNSSSLEVPTYVSADHCRLYITRQVEATGVIMMAKRPPK